jgi:hypothetical protein
MSIQLLPRSLQTLTNARRRGLRLMLALAAAAVLLGLALYHPFGREGFATPAACLDAYAAARQDGDAERYLRCLAEPLRAAARQRFPDNARLAESLREETAGIKGWVQASAPVVQGSVAQAAVDEVRADGVCRLHFRLERSGGGWLVAGVATSRARAAAIPYGTHVKDTPEEAEPAPAPK